MTKSHFVWKTRDQGRFSTPVIHNGLLYNLNGDIISCISIDEGERVYQLRLQTGARGSASLNIDRNREQYSVSQPPRGQRQGRGQRGGRGRGGFGGADYSSPVLGDGKIYYARGNGSVYVIQAGKEFKQIAVNMLGDGQESFKATPAISDGNLFYRSDKNLYCVGE